jgi:hypothetical protein
MASPLDNTSKPFDHARPFHRVNSRRFSTDRQRPDGLAYRCGARHPRTDYNNSDISQDLANRLRQMLTNFLLPGVGQILGPLAENAVQQLITFLSNSLDINPEAWIFRNMLRHLPAWVPVGRNQYDSSHIDEEVEIEGRLTRSFQGVYGLPFIQYKHFYPWNFHVQVDFNEHNKPPNNGFGWVIGNGNRPNRDEIEDYDNLLGQDEWGPVFDMTEQGDVLVNSIQCIIDVGAFSRTSREDSTQVLANQDGHPHGIMYEDIWPFWPMANDWFWAQGRWVYDCRHVRENGGTDSQTGKPNDTFWTQINPLRAFACYRYEGYKFKENEYHVPAARFQFFSCNRAGYHDFDDFSKIDEKDNPEFIIDLPELPESTEQILLWHIGDYKSNAKEFDTDEYARHYSINTGVFRQMIIWEIAYAPYGAGYYADQEINFQRDHPPEIEFLPPKEGTVPKQVKLKINLNKVTTNAYGFVISFGWKDPESILKDRVKKITVFLDQLERLHSADHQRFRFGVNGRFRYHFLNSANVVDGRHDLPTSHIDLYIPTDRFSRVQISTVAFNRRGYGEFMENRPNSSDRDPDRRLKMGGIFPLLTPELETFLRSNQWLNWAIQQFPNETREQLEQIRNTLLTTFGGRNPVTWHEHIDQRDHQLASRLAREVWYELILNAENQIQGFIDCERWSGLDHEDFGTRVTELIGGVESNDSSYTGPVIDSSTANGTRTFKIYAREAQKRHDWDVLLLYRFQTNEQPWSYLLTYRLITADQDAS